MENLTNRYLVDQIDWRPDINGEISDRLPIQEWIDVDMSDDFWRDHVTNYTNDGELSPRDALNSFLLEYLDKIYSSDLLAARIRSIDEIRDKRIDDILK